MSDSRSKEQCCVDYLHSLIGRTIKGVMICAGDEEPGKNRLGLTFEDGFQLEISSEGGLFGLSSPVIGGRCLGDLNSLALREITGDDPKDNDLARALRGGKRSGLRFIE